MTEKKRKRRIPWAEAKVIVDQLSAWLAARGDTFVMVGSMRRGRPFVGDIEFVVLPKDPKGFHGDITRLGFHAGEKRRNYVFTGYSRVPVEIYVAGGPDELGAMMLAYTGDYIFNIAMRSKAKRMGYRMDQYGIWKGSTPVLKSPDEREFFDFLGMEYHTPEERSLARRSQLKKIARNVLKSTRDPGIKAFAEHVLGVLKGRTPLDRDEEALLGRYSGMKDSQFYLSGSDSLGFQVPEEEYTEAREIIQGIYDDRVGRGGTIMYLDVTMAYNIVQVLAAVREEGEDVIYLLMELTDLPGEELERIAIDSREFLSDLVMAAGRGEVEFSWQGPWRPMIE